MKQLIGFTLLAAASFFAAQDSHAQTANTFQLQTAQYTAPPASVMTICDVNGLDYQVDFSNRIWGINGYGQWFVVGQILRTPNGPVALRNDGVRFPAICQ